MNQSSLKSNRTAIVLFSSLFDLRRWSGGVVLPKTKKYEVKLCKLDLTKKKQKIKRLRFAHAMRWFLFL